MSALSARLEACTEEELDRFEIQFDWHEPSRTALEDERVRRNAGVKKSSVRGTVKATVKAIAESES
jgi:hypothetical protein